METKNDESITDECLSLAKRVINMIGQIFEIASLEAALTGKSLLNIFVIILSILILLASTWISLLVLFILVSFSKDVSIFYIALSVISINACLIIFFSFLLKWHQKHLGFKITRKQLGATQKGEIPL